LSLPEHMSGVENGAERAVNRVNGSGAVSGHFRKRWSGAGPAGRGAESGLNRQLKSLLTPNIKDNRSFLTFC